MTYKLCGTIIALSIGLAHCSTSEELLPPDTKGTDTRDERAVVRQENNRQNPGLTTSAGSGSVTARANSEKPYGLLSAPRSIGEVPGFRHASSKSLLAFGGGAASVQKSTGFTRTVGTDATFVEWDNGFSLGLSHAGSAAELAPPLTARSEEHTARVLQYFKAAGIPADQLGKPSITTTLLRTGSDEGESSRKLVGYTTILERTVDGIPVADSHAWAQFNKDDAVVSEQVWWPSLPANLHADISSWKSMLSDQTSKARFAAKLPREFASERGELRIHHALPHGHAWYSAVTMDFAPRGAKFITSISIDGETLNFSSIDQVPGDPHPL